MKKTGLLVLMLFSINITLSNSRLPAKHEEMIVWIKAQIAQAETDEERDRYERLLQVYYFGAYAEVIQELQAEQQRIVR